MIYLKSILTDNKGLTLMEMLGAVAVLGILTAVIATNFDFAILRANQSGVNTDLRTLQMSVQSYYYENNALPDAAALNSSSDIKFGSNPATPGSEHEISTDVFVSQSLGNHVDPWGSPYIFIRDLSDTTDPVEQKWVFVSRGPDRLISSDPALDSDDIQLLICGGCPE